VGKSSDWQPIRSLQAGVRPAMELAMGLRLAEVRQEH
jgi:hypothetical protein